MWHPTHSPRHAKPSDDHAGRVHHSAPPAVSSLRLFARLHRVTFALLVPLLIALAPSAVSGTHLTGVAAARKAMVPNGTLTSVWGDPRSGGRTHQGEDLAAPRGSPIYAPARLSIYSNTWSTLGGWTVSGRDAKGRRWYFGHLNSRSARAVGSTVYKGQIIGYVGSTGSATGPHLHYQVSYPGGSWGNPVYVLRYYPDVP
jgi:murein DD-endopeptidase MepM/ murein hydrolase activator NlpD